MGLNYPRLLVCMGLSFEYICMLCICWYYNTLYTIWEYPGLQRGALPDLLGIAKDERQELLHANYVDFQEATVSLKKRTSVSGRTQQYSTLLGTERLTMVTLQLVLVCNLWALRNGSLNTINTMSCNKIGEISAADATNSEHSWLPI